VDVGAGQVEALSIRGDRDGARHRFDRDGGQHPDRGGGLHRNPAGLRGAAPVGDVGAVAVRAQGDAPTEVVIVGDSVGSEYAEILRQLAVNSNGKLQTINETMASCVFTQDLIYREGASPACEGRKNSAVDLINTIKPDAVIISNAYTDERVQGSSGDMTMAEWSDSLQRIMDRFRGSTKRVVLLSPPPSNAPIRDCTSKRNSKPADCVGSIPDPWKVKAETERRLAGGTGAVWIDSRPWFCNSKGRCPSFVGTTPARFDRAHMTSAYASKILPVVAETFRGAGVPIPSSG
jgi:hypothetical protein